MSDRTIVICASLLAAVVLAITAAVLWDDLHPCARRGSFTFEYSGELNLKFPHGEECIDYHYVVKP